MLFNFETCYYTNFISIKQSAVPKSYHHKMLIQNVSC